MDVVLHALQRRLGPADAVRFLRSYRLERMARLGVPAGCGGNELNRNYVMSWTMKGFIGDSLDRHFSSVFGVAGATFQPVLHGFGVLVVFWCILFWMYRKKIFLRI